MLVNFLQFLANLIIAMALLRVATVKLLERNPDSTAGKTLALLF